MREKRSDADPSPKDVFVSHDLALLERGQRLRDLKERVDRGEYVVDLSLLACVLVDSHAPLGQGRRPSDFA